MGFFNSKNIYRFKFIYEMTNKITTKNIYADNIEEAKKLFAQYYKDCLDVRILNITLLKREENYV